jgi:transposase
MKTAVETIFVGKDRQFNRRFLQMCSHHLVEPVACTSASGWEKGQVENHVGLVREPFFTPRLRFMSYDELNAWLIDKCIAWAKAHGHPERPDQTRSGRCSRRSGRSSFPIAAASTGSTRCRPRSRRPA